MSNRVRLTHSVGSIIETPRLIIKNIHELEGQNSHKALLHRTLLSSDWDIHYPFACFFYLSRIFFNMLLLFWILAL
jgi:hypothetical protein